MKVFIFFLTLYFCNFHNNLMLHINNFTFGDQILGYLKKPENMIDNDIISILVLLRKTNIENFFSDNYNKIKIDKECESFLNSLTIKNIFTKKREIVNNIAKKIIKNGFFSNTIEGEEECLQSNEIYFIVKTHYSRSSIYQEINEYKNQYKLFIEQFSFDDEFCLWSVCKDLYVHDYKLIAQNISDIVKEVFKVENFELVGFNYKINKTTNYEFEHKDDYKDFIQRIKLSFWLILILLLLCTIISIYKENREENEDIDEENRLKAIEIEKIINEDTSSSKTGTSIFYKKKYEKEKSKEIKILNTFNIINNFLLLNKKKEPLSNQNSLTELSTIIFIILFFILLSENTYIIMKYYDNRRTLFEFLKNWNFSFIKFGFVAYEYYKIICGVIFGFKFINYYYKQKEFSFKRIIRFLFKFIPYFIIFLIIYFILQYHSVEFVSIIKRNLRNYYFSKKINDCYYCHQKYYNVFNPLMLGKYNSTESYPAQYDGCLRTTLFTICEFICYIFIIILMTIFLKIKSELLEIIFFIINLVILPLAYILSREGKDLDYYSMSRLFGLSASISLPYLFFPLYYIGFNIGIIYYYNQHQTEAYNDLNKNNYIPFEYCFKLSLFLRGINEKIKSVILILCFIFIFLIISNFTFVIGNQDNLYFKFNLFSKFMYVYEGILFGIFFCVLIAISLSYNSENTLSVVLSSEFIFFINKLSFILFNIIIPSLKVFNGINILGIYLSTINLYLISMSLYILICLIVITFAISIFYPIKWFYFYIINGFDYDEYE